MRIDEGLASHGLPAGERELRPPKEETYNPLKEAAKFMVLAVASILYGVAAACWRCVSKRLFQDPVSLKGRVCFVTGSGRGLGREICLALAREGAIIACAEINDVTNAETLELIKKKGGKAVGYKLNVANKQEVEEVAKRVEKELGPVYLVVNNAAIVMPVKDPSEEFIRASFNVNVLGCYWVTGAFLPSMKERNEGQIVNIGSITSYYGFPYITTYSSTKAAIRSFTKSLSTQLRTENSNNKVKISIINPTFINTTEDYGEMLQCRITPLSMEAVVNKLLRKVKYDWHFDVSSPFYMKFLLCLIQMLPDDVFIFAMNRMTSRAIFPNKEEFEKLPPGKIVRLCSGVDSKKEN